MRSKYSKGLLILLLVLEVVIGMEMEASSFAICDSCDDNPHDDDDDDDLCREDRTGRER